MDSTMMDPSKTATSTTTTSTSMITTSITATTTSTAMMTMLTTITTKSTSATTTSITMATTSTTATIPTSTITTMVMTTTTSAYLAVPNDMSTMTTTTSAASSVVGNGLPQRQGSTRRLIKVDYSVIQDLYGDDEDEDEMDGENMQDLKSGKKFNGDTMCRSTLKGSDCNSNTWWQNKVMFRTGIDNSRDGLRQLWQRSYLRSAGASSNNPYRLDNKHISSSLSPLQRSASVNIVNEISSSPPTTVSSSAIASSANKRASVNCSLL